MEVRDSGVDRKLEVLGVAFPLVALEGAFQRSVQSISVGASETARHRHPAKC